MIPYAGINGLMLMAGMQRFFHEQQACPIPRAGVSPAPALGETEEMLRQDIPVIMSVGPNFPDDLGQTSASAFTQKRRAAFSAAGRRRIISPLPAWTTNGCASPPGGGSTISTGWNLRRYTHEHSLCFVSNILLWIKKMRLPLGSLIFFCIYFRMTLL